MNNHVFRKKLFYQNLLSAMNIAPLLCVFAVERSSVEVTSTESSTLINQSRTRLVTKVVRVWYANSYDFPFRKLNFQTTIMERKHCEQQTLPICYIEFRGPFYIQNLEKRRKIVIFAVGYGVKAVTHCNCLLFRT